MLGIVGTMNGTQAMRGMRSPALSHPIVQAPS